VFLVLDVHVTKSNWTYHFFFLGWIWLYFI